MTICRVRKGQIVKKLKKLFEQGKYTLENLTMYKYKFEKTDNTRSFVKYYSYQETKLY